MGFIEYGLGIVTGLVIGLIILSSNLSNNSQLQIGTTKENAILMQKVAELQTQNYTITYQQHISDNPRLIENYSDFTLFLEQNQLHELHYTLYGTLGPKIFTGLNGTDYYWRAD